MGLHSCSPHAQSLSAGVAEGVVWVSVGSIPHKHIHADPAFLVHFNPSCIWNVCSGAWRLRVSRGSKRVHTYLQTTGAGVAPLWKRGSWEPGAGQNRCGTKTAPRQWRCFRRLQLYLHMFIIHLLFPFHLNTAVHGPLHTRHSWRAATQIFDYIISGL